MKTDAKYLEIEFKYSAKNISLQSFSEFVSTLKGPFKYKEASGYDYFYDDPQDEDGFYRLRIGHDIRQITYKHKTKEVNNYVRDEHNLNLVKSMTFDAMVAYVASLGYTFNNKIFKSCFIYEFETYTLVYYVCSDSNISELGRFIEIEMKEDYPWSSQMDAWNELVALERICKPLGVSPQARVKRSLFELYKK